MSTATMNSLRVMRAAARTRTLPTGYLLQRRGYAEAVSDKIKLTLALPHQVRHSHRGGSWVMALTNSE